MKTPVELNSLFSKFFVISPGLVYHLIRRDTGRLANEAFTSNLIVSSKQKLSGLKITNCSRHNILKSILAYIISKNVSHREVYGEIEDTHV